MNGLMTQLVRIEPGNNIEEAHMRNRALIAHWVLKHAVTVPEGSVTVPEGSPKGSKPFLLDVLKPHTPALVLVGPEGDFSIDEVQAAKKAGFRAISLGTSRLRTETAALAAVHLMRLANR